MGSALPGSGPAAPPRANGELVFEAPWESRAFGMAVSLQERGIFGWDEFRERLIDEIARFEREHPGARSAAAGYCYYERWLAALERLLADKGLCAPAELSRRAADLAERPAHEPVRRARKISGSAGPERAPG
jgi:nitrile hydratase accessory protein